MEPKEAIKRIQDHRQIHIKNEQHATLLDEALNDAIKALEKQVPRKPYLWNGLNYICPNCHRSEYIANIPLNTHCGFCGQKIDWSEEV